MICSEATVMLRMMHPRIYLLSLPVPIMLFLLILYHLTVRLIHHAEFFEDLSRSLTHALQHYPRNPARTDTIRKAWVPKQLEALNRISQPNFRDGSFCNWLVGIWIAAGILNKNPLTGTLKNPVFVLPYNYFSFTLHRHRSYQMFHVTVKTMSTTGSSILWFWQFFLALSLNQFLSPC